MKKHTLTHSLVAIVIAVATVAGVAVPTFADAQHDALCQGAQGTSSGNSCASSTGGPTLMQTIGSITNVIIYILGAIAVVMIIVGGIRYATSGGDQNSVSGAKNTILYAVIGLVVALMAYAIVNFVLANVH
jgi:hypothetical protein